MAAADTEHRAAMAKLTPSAKQELLCSSSYLFVVADTCVWELQKLTSLSQYKSAMCKVQCPTIQNSVMIAVLCDRISSVMIPVGLLSCISCYGEQVQLMHKVISLPGFSYSLLAAFLAVSFCTAWLLYFCYGATILLCVAAIGLVCCCLVDSAAVELSVSEDQLLEILGGVVSSNQAEGELKQHIKSITSQGKGQSEPDYSLAPEPPDQLGSSSKEGADLIPSHHISCGPSEQHRTAEYNRSTNLRPPTDLEACTNLRPTPADFRTFSWIRTCTAQIWSISELDQQTRTALDLTNLLGYATGFLRAFDAGQEMLPSFARNGGLRCERSNYQLWLQQHVLLLFCAFPDIVRPSRVQSLWLNSRSSGPSIRSLWLNSCSRPPLVRPSQAPFTAGHHAVLPVVGWSKLRSIGQRSVSSEQAFLGSTATGCRSQSGRQSSRRPFGLNGTGTGPFIGQSFSAWAVSQPPIRLSQSMRWTVQPPGLPSKPIPVATPPIRWLPR
ncbi:hypothetical protein RHGRI_030605 [Rhododendron griersonianum]|uniref:Uncharacterized protein n=1 Tax=Rhododendron griersonianum TaxID=479676 RepID=A0AAV6I7W7_9ERIC|nr:hypothetical protein RHGRI_030605 [Rhododendron griersonianum]